MKFRHTTGDNREYDRGFCLVVSEYELCLYVALNRVIHRFELTWPRLYAPAEQPPRENES